MSKPVVHLEAPIVPDEGLGGLELRTKIGDVQELFMGLGLYQSGSCELVPPFEARYSLGKGEVQVGVDVRNGKIFKIIAGSGYQGSLFGKIFIGMEVGEAMTREPCLHYSESEEAVLYKGCPGVTLDVPEIDPSPETVPAMRISAISVYATEAFSLDGQRGRW